MGERGASKLMMPLLFIVSAALIVLTQFGFIFLLLALLPSIVAYYVDNEPGSPIFKIVFTCNFAATLPSIMPMLTAAVQLKHFSVTPLLQDPYAWLFVYSGAAAGWALIFLCRFVARLIVSMMYEYNVATLEKFQEHLVEEWGQQIKQPPR